VNNSFSLYSKLSGTKLASLETVFSLDVISLFTNIPIDLALESLSNRWKFLSSKTKIPKAEFIEMTKFILNSTYFTFNRKIYKQSFGTPMGSPLSPIIADMVMQDLKNFVLSSLGLDHKFYYRYVDDIVMTAKTSDISYILDRFNGYHERIQFTVETD